MALPENTLEYDTQGRQAARRGRVRRVASGALILLAIVVAVLIGPRSWQRMQLLQAQDRLRDVDESKVVTVIASNTANRFSSAKAAEAVIGGHPQLVMLRRGDLERIGVVNFIRSASVQSGSPAMLMVVPVTLQPATPFESVRVTTARNAMWSLPVEWPADSEYVVSPARRIEGLPHKFSIDLLSLPADWQTRPSGTKTVVHFSRLVGELDTNGKVGISFGRPDTAEIVLPLAKDADGNFVFPELPTPQG